MPRISYGSFRQRVEIALGPLSDAVQAAYQAPSKGDEWIGSYRCFDVLLMRQDGTGPRVYAAVRAPLYYQGDRVNKSTIRMDEQFGRADVTIQPLHGKPERMRSIDPVAIRVSADDLPSAPVLRARAESERFPPSPALSRLGRTLSEVPWPGLTWHAPCGGFVYARRQTAQMPFAFSASVVREHGLTGRSMETFLRKLDVLQAASAALDSVDKNALDVLERAMA